MEKIIAYQPEIWLAIWQTFIMVGISILAAILIGLPLGTYLYLSRKGNLYEHKLLFSILDTFVNIVRSFPFLLLVVFLIPFTRLVVGTAIGTTAATVPLSIIAFAYYARLVEQSLLDVPKGIIEAAISMGATKTQIIFKFLYREARSGLIFGLTTATISFVSYSTVMGIVGGGGVGDFAIRYGYQRFETELMTFTIIMMVILVQIIQVTGTTVSKKLDKRS
ncbi:methionine ABC transporter permease [Sporosarcina ureilytica]|uniref:Methionine ABC transporter ATP-binding protein n=1 Tax=Sporosarcina ureilytica TaxID=298596 RepID=A0A1D8JG27_9BACL|nr:methionine ABC transporter permease [Sporosarcina ureilytica]AOV07662.1 methionine ABC transporter ATP-binding protein [Sporosarcina ureilytica]